MAIDKKFLQGNEMSEKTLSLGKLHTLLHKDISAFKAGMPFIRENFVVTWSFGIWEHWPNKREAL